MSLVWEGKEKEKIITLTKIKWGGGGSGDTSSGFQGGTLRPQGGRKKGKGPRKETGTSRGCYGEKGVLDVRA